MIDYPTAVERLTRSWHDVLSPTETGLDRYTPVEYSPLLVMLDEACRSNTGNHKAGAGADPASRSLLDLEAFSLREHIDGTVRAWLSRLSKERQPRDLIEAVNALVGILAAHHAARTITDVEHDRITAMFPRWCDRIWALYLPLVVKELAGACPNPDCEQTQFTDGEGKVGRALIAFYTRNTGQVSARCRACEWTWRSPAELRLLGQWLGASQDDEFLEAVGL